VGSSDGWAGGSGPLTSELTIGSEFAGHRLEALVARGGMGVIYRATQLRPSRPVALKLVSPGLVDHAGLRERFKRESEIAASIDHPNVIPIYQTGEEDGAHFIAMRWVEGTDLGTLIDREGRLEPHRAARIVSQVANALDAAHAHGLVHRDVKPGNILIAADDHVYLTDFGLTRRSESERLTRTGHWVGTLDYVAPEQILGQPTSARSDVYSLGCVLYETLTGCVPYGRETDAATLWAHVHAPAPSVLEVSTEIPAEFDAVIARALAKDPADRHPNAGALGEEAMAVALATRGDGGGPAGTMSIERSASVARRVATGGRPTTAPTDTPLAIPVPTALEAAGERRLFGRDRELAELQEALGAALSGGRRGAMLAGDPGIGKTTLAAALAVKAEKSGAAILYGRCDEDFLIPYRPFVEALGHLVTHAPAGLLDRHVDDYGGILGRLVPQLSQRLGSRRPALSTQGDLYMLFSAVAALLSAASARQPLVVVLDDLHWADSQTISLLRYLLTSPTPMTGLVLGTYRPTDLGREHGLIDLVADLYREPELTWMLLEGLDEDAIVQMTAARARHELDDEGVRLAQALHDETKGNPFFTIEILRNLAESGQLVRESGRWSTRRDISEIALPRTVRETIKRRVVRLGRRAESELGGRIEEVLGTAAVVGREIDVELLGQVLEEDRDDLLDVLETAREAALVTEAPGPTRGYSFSHALIEHALYDGLRAPVRRRTHRLIAEALERICGPEPGPRIGELAHHWLEGMQPDEAPKVLDYLRRAAEAAVTKLAPSEAVRLYKSALELHERYPGGGEQMRCELLIGLGDAQRQRGDPEHRQTLLDAARLAQTIGDGDRLIRAALCNTRGFVSETGEVDSERVAILNAALDAIGEADSSSHARLLATLAAELTFSGDWRRRLELSDRGLAMARRIGDPATLGTVLSSRFMTVWTPETLDERCADTAAELDLVERGGGDLIARFWALHWRAIACVEAGDLHEAERRFEEEDRIADRLGQPTARWLAAYDRAIQALFRGRLEEAEQYAVEAGRIGSESGQPEAEAFFGGQLVNIRFEQGRLAELEPLIDEQLKARPGIPAFRAALALARSEGGLDDEARETIAVDAARDFDEFPYDSNWLVGLSIYAQACGSLGETGAATSLARLLDPWGAQIAYNSATVWGSVSRLLGVLLGVLGRYEAAEQRLEHAARLHDRIGAPIWLARTRVDLAHVLLAWDRPADGDRARRLLEQALAAAAELGCAGIERRASGLLGGADTQLATHRSHDLHRPPPGG
jgi:tetratricopeptide (TPR) repeat protein/predicted Ser/Thr protein kinase